MPRLLRPILRSLIRNGQLTVEYSDGTVDVYGDGQAPRAAFALRSAKVARRLVFSPGLAFGESYMDGMIVPQGCDIFDVLDVIFLNIGEGHTHAVARVSELLRHRLRRWAQFNPATRARRNVAHHYDLNGRLYSLFLDADQQYSCAYFQRGDETLEAAQLAKKRHIAAKLCLGRPDLEVLDIGCGWGGMAMTLAQEYGARVTGITLSQEQLATARARAAAAGLADRVRFELLDYRDVHKPFDRIVSVGMFEHVGLVHYPEFFSVVHRCLKPDGVALLHAIGRSDGPGTTNPWVEKYIFPGGYAPALSEVFGPLERSGLMATDCEILRLHYAKTLSHWRQRFTANREKIAALYDERFCRMFEMYLAGSELAFRRQRQVIFQLQLARTQEALPLTRDYMLAADSQMAAVAQAAD